MRTIIFIAMAVVWLVSCVDDPATTASNNYFDLDSLLEKQRVDMVQTGVQLIKEVSLEDSTEIQTLPGDSATLSAEFKVFNAINPSQPMYINAFDITDGQNGATVYTNVDGSAELRKLVIDYDREAITKISGVVSERTSIYTAYREMSLHFEGGNLVLYSVQGYQKMIFSDTVFFGIRTNIVVGGDN